MALSARQEACYVDLADIWKPAVSVSSSTGLPGTETYSKIASAVACYFQMNPNVSEPNGAGRLNRQILFTQDILHTDRDQDVDVDYIVKNVSLNDDGTASANSGRFWRVLGLARAFNSRVDRAMGKKEFRISIEEVPPPGVS